MMRFPLLLALALTLSSCSLFGDDCLILFGDECDALGDWQLSSIDGERATGQMELETVGDAYLALPSGVEGCGDLRGAARWSMSDTEGTFGIRLWQARAACDDDGIHYVVDFYGTYELDGDRLTARWRPDARFVRPDGTRYEAVVPSLGESAVLVFTR